VSRLTGSRRRLPLRNNPRKAFKRVWHIRRMPRGIRYLKAAHAHSNREHKKTYNDNYIYCQVFFVTLMSMAALQLMLARLGFAGIIVFSASIIYLFSDTFMAYLLFHGKPKYFNLITMIPYIYSPRIKRKRGRLKTMAIPVVRISAEGCAQIKPLNPKI